MCAWIRLIHWPLGVYKEILFKGQYFSICSLRNRECIVLVDDCGKQVQAILRLPELLPSSGEWWRSLDQQLKTHFSPKRSRHLATRIGVYHRNLRHWNFAQHCISTIVGREDLCFCLYCICCRNLSTSIQNHGLCLSFKSCRLSFNLALKILKTKLDALIKKVPVCMCTIHVWSVGLAARAKGRFSHTTFYSSFPSLWRLADIF